MDCPEYLNVPADVAVPPGVTTEMAPLVPLATTAVMDVALSTLKKVHVPPKDTAIAPARFVPIIVTVSPLAADVGVKELITGAGINVNHVRVPVASGVVTLTLPLVPLATTAVMDVALSTLNEAAAVPPKLTAVAPVKLYPVIVTVPPCPAEVGVNEVIVGTGTYVNVPAEVPVPPGVVTLTLPLFPLSTTAVMDVALTTLNEAAAVPPKLTSVASARFVPVIVTVSQLAADVGVKEPITGAGTNVNPASVPVPSGAVTLILPLVPLATTAVMDVALTTLNEAAAVPPKLTVVAPVKLVPVIVTVIPGPAEVGLKDVIVGTGTYVNVPDEVAVPPGVVTEMVPLVPLATTAVMDVALTTLKETAAVPPKLTSVASARFVPVIVTVSPLVADVGVKELITGAGTNVNPASVPVPSGVVTLILPLVPLATTAVMDVALTTLNEAAAVPPKLTAVAPVKLVPVIVTVAPGPAEVGVNEVIVGTAVRSKQYLPSKELYFTCQTTVPLILNVFTCCSVDTVIGLPSAPRALGSR